MIVGVLYCPMAKDLLLKLVLKNLVTYCVNMVAKVQKKNLLL